jgi:DNA helicase HerA-like ATPase
MKNRITLILGQTGSGKTTLAKKLTETEPRLLILDHTNLEYRNGMILKSLSDLTDYTKKKSPKQFRLILRFSDDDEVSAALDYAWELGDVTVLAEEVDTICSPYQIDEALEKIIKYGRHKNIRVVAVSRRPAEVNRLLSAMAGEIISFRQTEAVDLEYLKKRGFSDEELRNLERFQYLTVN